MRQRNKETQAISEARVCINCGNLKSSDDWYPEPPSRKRAYCKECTRDWNRNARKKMRRPLGQWR